MLHLILKAKIANSALIEQEGRQDVKHARMMLICTRAFIDELLASCREGHLSERAVVNILDEIREIFNSHEAEKSSKLWGLDYSSVWPFEQLREFNEDKIARWLEHRFPANGL